MADAERYLPNFIWVIEVPERPSDLAKRWHNKYAKEALREAVEKWHGDKQGFAKHFRRDARERYQHFPRAEKYKQFKARKYKSTVDLIKTGRTKTRMLSQWKMQAGGSAEGGNLSATLILTFPFKGGTGRFRNDIQRSANRQRQAELNQRWILRMRTELQRFDEQDPLLLADWFKQFYMKKVDAHRAGRKRLRKPTR